MKHMRLKAGVPGFAMTDGPLAGRSYLPGQVYRESEIPAEHAHRFEVVKRGPGRKFRAQTKAANPPAAVATTPAAPDTTAALAGVNLDTETKAAPPDKGKE